MKIRLTIITLIVLAILPWVAIYDLCHNKVERLQQQLNTVTHTIDLNGQNQTNTLGVEFQSSMWIGKGRYKVVFVPY